jgi:omega-amidase
LGASGVRLRSRQFDPVIPRVKPKDPHPSDRLTVALGEYDTGWHDPVLSLALARVIAQQARAAGADLLVLPEMCATGFTMDADGFAEPANGPSSRALSALAAEHQLWVVAGLSMRRNGRYLNSALAFAPDGSLVATYDKQRLFGYAKETAVYSAGTSPCVIKLGGLSVGLFVCFDLRFPELFREAAAEVDAFIIIANWPSARQQHWDVLTHARAIENQCYVVAVNRTGEGDGLEYNGGSQILDPWGTRCDVMAPGSSLRIGELSRRMVSKVRETFPLSLASAGSRKNSKLKKSTRKKSRQAKPISRTASSKRR